MDNTISVSAKLYKDVTIIGSSIDDESSIGDFTKIEKSQIEDFVRIDRNNYIYGSSIGRHTYTGSNTKIIASRIGRFCSISWNVTIGGGNHDYTQFTNHSFLYDSYSCLRPDNIDPLYDRLEKPVNIGSDVWIGAGAIILRGVNIGDGAVIGAGTVVTKDVPPYAIVAGNPGKILRYRFDDDMIEKIKESMWWDLPDEEIRDRFVELSNLGANDLK